MGVPIITDDEESGFVRVDEDVAVTDSLTDDEISSVIDTDDENEDVVSEILAEVSVKGAKA